MPILRGEDINLAVGLEAVRGEEADSKILVRGRTPTGLAPAQESTPIKETRGSKVASEGIEITQKRAEGDFEFNVRTKSIGYFLASLLGKVTSVAKAAPNAAVYDHTFEILEGDPEHPTLSGFVSQGGNHVDYKYLMMVVASLSFEVKTDDLVIGVAGLIASSETEMPAGTYNGVQGLADDDYFRHYDVSIKLAADVAGLAAASPVLLKSFKLDLPNGSKPDQNISELNPGNMLAGKFEMKGSFELDYQNEDMHDVFTGGTYKALQLSMVRSDKTIGSNQHPGLVVTLPRISFKLKQNRPIDDVVRDVIDFDIHYDPTADKAISAVLTNTVASYEADDES